MTILVTGGAGYIGSHTLVQLINANFDVVVIDNLSNSSVESLHRVELITGVMPSFYNGDIQDQALLDRIFSKHNISAVVHFAGLKSVSESIDSPLHYYRNNISGTLALCETMAKHHIFKLVFSSSANVYGLPDKVPVTEDMPTRATNPYGRTKLMIEQMLTDLHGADSRWSVALLRYFNPVGAHESGLIGEDPQGTPANIMPFISQVAIGQRSELSVFGGDYDTPDGTGVRDYIHVVDLADAHLKSLEYLDNNLGIHTFNIGTGSGYSVLELVNAFTSTTGIPVPYAIKDRRPGDIGASWANADRANSQLGWAATRSLSQMMTDSWRWQSLNPNGYTTQSGIKQG
ncbi:MAG: UDP-glucose 4-epimerase GalE [Psychrosphaera sp.]|nr:UDP-glucose 4-epimerase GalE [Psychrosphaera sp.]